MHEANGETPQPRLSPWLALLEMPKQTEDSKQRHSPGKIWALISPLIHVTACTHQHGSSTV